MHDAVDDRSDAELIGASQSGDLAAFGALVRRHQRGAIRVAAIALGSPEGADDVAQEAFVKAHAAIHRFRDGSPFAPWLYRIVTNTARTRQRHQGRQRALQVRAATLAAVGAADPAEVAAHHEQRRALVDAINRLAPQDRLILAYRWYDQLSEAEIAQALGCRRGTVKSRLSRAMQRLRTELEPIDAPEEP